MLARIEDTKLKALGPYFVGQIVDYVGTPATTARRYQLSARRWHIIQTKAQQETAVVDDLEDVKFAGYCPMVKATRAVRPHVHRTIRRPMFPGYVFAGFDPNGEEWDKIRDLDGVIRLFMINLVPVPVAHFVMERIRAKEIELGLPKVILAAPIMVKIGEVVRVLAGPFAAFFGVVREINSKKRTLRVEMDIFGRKTPVELEVEQVEAV